MICRLALVRSFSWEVKQNTLFLLAYQRFGRFKMCGVLSTLTIRNGGVDIGYHRIANADIRGGGGGTPAQDMSLRTAEECSPGIHLAWWSIWGSWDPKRSLENPVATLTSNNKVAAQFKWTQVSALLFGLGSKHFRIEFLAAGLEERPQVSELGGPVNWVGVGLDSPCPLSGVQRLPTCTRFRKRRVMSTCAQANKLVA